MKTVNVPSLQVKKHLVKPGYAGAVKPIYNWYVSGWSEKNSSFDILATFWNEEDANLFIKAKGEQ